MDLTGSHLKCFINNRVVLVKEVVEILGLARKRIFVTRECTLCWKREPNLGLPRIKREGDLGS